jgi:hypothetical protein
MVIPVANDRGSPWLEHWTALISLGIPKLVRFVKIPLQESLLSLLWYLDTATTDRASRARHLRGAALRPRRLIEFSRSTAY